MATPNAGVLDTVLNTFRTQIDGGFGALQGPVHGTLGTLIVISVVLMALFWAMDESGSIFSPLIRKVLVIGWWSYLILNWQTTALAVFTAFGALGAQVGGAGGLSGFLNQPSKVVQSGLENAQVLLDLASYYMGNANTDWGPPPAMQSVGIDIMAAFQVVLASAVNAAEAACAALLILIAYCWLALEIVVTVIEFHIVILMGFCVLPFGVFERTASYAERVLSYVISAGFKVMALGVVIGLSQTFLANYKLNYTPGSLPGLDAMAGLALCVLIVLMLAISAPKYAAAVVSGHASTGMGQLAGAGGLALGTGLAIAGGVKAVANGASNAIDGASKVAAHMRGDNFKPPPGFPSGGTSGSPSGGSSGGPSPSVPPAASPSELAQTVGPSPAPANNNSPAPPGSPSSPRSTASESASAGRRMSELASTIHSLSEDGDGGEPPPSTGRGA